MVRTYLSTKEAAAYLGLEPCTLADWRWRRKGPPWIPVSRGCVRYDLEVLNRWLDSRTVHEIPEKAQAGLPE